MVKEETLVILGIGGAALFFLSRSDFFKGLGNVGVGVGDVVGGIGSGVRDVVGSVSGTIGKTAGVAQDLVGDIGEIAGEGTRALKRVGEELNQQLGRVLSIDDKIIDAVRDKFSPSVTRTTKSERAILPTPIKDPKTGTIFLNPTPTQISRIIGQQSERIIVLN